MNDNKFLDLEGVIALNRHNIEQALEDYRRHTWMTDDLDRVSDEFISRLAHDSAISKTALRDLFRKSPAWNEQLQAIVINGNRTHEPDSDFIIHLGCEILGPARDAGRLSAVDQRDIILYFASKTAEEETQEMRKRVINRVAPGAYAPGKKPSRVFKAICQALGVADETKGSNFQRLYAQFADEISAKKLPFKLFMSINPAHFVTMSNPKGDNRGDTLISCHSFNNNEYSYRNGCSGYARDENTFIVFTVEDPDDPETLNNRKTTRQIFAYKPGNGVLLQSRFYNTSGGTRGAQEDSVLYRDLIQRELADLEGFPNLWKTYKLHSESVDSDIVRQGYGFGGYADWEYDEFDPKISFQTDHIENHEYLEVGAWGLCVECGEETDRGLYCKNCEASHNRCTCDDCGGVCDDLTAVYDEYGREIYVCEDCLSSHYSWCYECEEYHHDSDSYYVHNERGYGRWVCGSCRDRNYVRCEDCEEYYPEEVMIEVIGSDGYRYDICNSCYENGGYVICSECEDVVCIDAAHEYTDPETGEVLYCCPDCWDDVEERIKKTEREKAENEEAENNEEENEEAKKEVSVCA